MYQTVPFAVANAWQLLELLKLQHRYRAAEDSMGYDVVYADIRGLSGPHGTLESYANSLCALNLTKKELKAYIDHAFSMY